MGLNIASKIIAYNKQLTYVGDLPPDFAVINPFTESPETVQVMRKFYKKFYDDDKQRKLILGINPGRLGAGATGIPFTDTKRLLDCCGINMQTVKTHEVSSVFLYDVIKSYGGPMKFYHNFYINSPFPLAIIRKNRAGKWVNANYYDDNLLFEMTKDFMINALKCHLTLARADTEVIVLGKKNAKYIQAINKEAHLFESMQVLDHPRYIQQYKYKERTKYINHYLEALYRE